MEKKTNKWGNNYRINETIIYPNGAKLIIFNNGKQKYFPSKEFELKRSKYSLKSSVSERINKHNEIRNLFRYNRCKNGDILLDKILKMYEVFDFTKK